MTTVSAMQQYSKAPLLTDSSDSAGDAGDKGTIYRLKATWEKLTSDGDPAGPMPSYPG
jgi:hypothetical protein